MSMTEAHKVYLTAELRKFNSTTWSEKFLREIPREDKDFLGQLGLPLSPMEFSSSLESHPLILEFLEKVPSPQIDRLSRVLSTFRNNGVYGKIIPHGNWITVPNVQLANVFVYPAEETLKGLFKKNNWKLFSIVADQDLWKAEPYNRWSKDREVEFRTCLADKLSGDAYKIFDGVHRAIQLAWREEDTTDICCPG